MKKVVRATSFREPKKGWGVFHRLPFRKSIKFMPRRGSSSGFSLALTYIHRNGSDWLRMHRALSATNTWKTLFLQCMYSKNSGAISPKQQGFEIIR